MRLRTYLIEGRGGGGGRGKDRLECVEDHTPERQPARRTIVAESQRQKHSVVQKE